VSRHLILIGRAAGRGAFKGAALVGGFVIVAVRNDEPARLAIVEMKLGFIAAANLVLHVETRCFQEALYGRIERADGASSPPSRSASLG
jgi:hypothetical protein